MAKTLKDGHSFPFDNRVRHSALFQSSREEANRFVSLTENRSDTGSGRIDLENEGLVRPGSQSKAETTSFLRAVIASREA